MLYTPAMNATAEELGFTTPTALIAAPDPMTPLSDADVEKQLSDAIRQKALVHVDVLSEMMYERAIQPETSARTMLDTIETNIKLAGLSAKRAAEENAGAGVSITINIPSQVASAPNRVITVQAEQPVEILADATAT